jgi:Pyruvate/2-oxoacid:ferredoxin oxidoreductase gamma subunit
VTLSLTPSTATVKAGFSTYYAAAVGNTTNTGVSWALADFPGDFTYPGSIFQGVYTAPSPVLIPDSFIVFAVANADPTKTASATVKTIPLENQEQQSFPIKLGASGFNANSRDCCSGTLGSLLVDQKGKQYILSNNHVLGRVGHAAPGESIVQPGFVDTLCNFSSPKTVANLTFAPPITSNVDAAIAQVVVGAVDDHGEIIGLGGIASDGSYISAAPANTTASATVGMSVAKSGRTTGLTCGTVLAIGMSLCVDMPSECGNPSGMIACFHGQVAVAHLTQPGDSGSLIVDADTSQPLALVAAGSADGQFSTANPVTDILAALSSGTGSTFSFVGGGEHPVSCTSPSQAVSKQELAAKSPVIPAEEIAHAMDVQRKYESQIMRDTAVLGVAIGASEVSPGHASLLVFVEKGKVPQQLSAALDGVAVRLIETGRFRANAQPSSATPSNCILGKSPRAADSPDQHRLDH